MGPVILSQNKINPTSNSVNLTLHFLKCKAHIIWLKTFNRFCEILLLVDRLIAEKNRLGEKKVNEQKHNASKVTNLSWQILHLEPCKYLPFYMSR